MKILMDIAMEVSIILWLYLRQNIIYFKLIKNVSQTTCIKFWTYNFQQNWNIETNNYLFKQVTKNYLKFLVLNSSAEYYICYIIILYMLYVILFIYCLY